jgi:hypothetical protein
MSATTPNNANLKAEAAMSLSTALAGADAVAAQGLQSLSAVHQARLARLNRAAASAAIQFGLKSPEATQAEAAAAAAKTTAARVEMLRQQGIAPTVQVAAGGWALQGRVYHADSSPAAAYCVFFVDQKNAYQSAYGFAYTDATGYFLLNYAGDAAGQATPAAAAASPELFVQIWNVKAQLAYTTAFAPTLGVVSYRAYTLPAGEPPIGDPPTALRNTALPPAAAAKVSPKTGVEPTSKVTNK